MYDIDSSLVDTYVEDATPCEKGDEKMCLLFFNHYIDISIPKCLFKKTAMP